ncbi:MAG: DUF2868 domain-containing protein, partial [Pseudomonadales bacterium]
MPKPHLADVIDVRRWLADDRDHSLADRLQRDRAIGREIVEKQDIERISAWWQRVGPEGDESVGHRVMALSRLAVVVLLAAGVALGVAVGSVAFGYEGDYPVNLLALLGVLVGIPLLLLVLTLVLLMPVRLPGLSAVRDAVSAVNPGRWVGAWLDRHTDMRLYAGFSSSESDFSRWQLVVFSQWIAVGYFVGILVIGWLLVAVTDLAFGWSTTLNMEAATVHRWLSWAAIPWQSWLPIAVPDAALVEASRFYRLDTVAVPLELAAQLGQWWPFVLMMILVYGLLPRCALLLVGRWRLGMATRSLLCDDPEVLALLDRLAAPGVDFIQQAEIAGQPLTKSVPAPLERGLDEQTGIVLWNEALAEGTAQAWLSANLGTGGGPVVTVGIWQSDTDIRARLRAVPPD